MTALIKMWHFLEGILSPLAGKKVKQKLVPCTHQEVTFFRQHFTTFDGKKGDAGATALYGGKRKCTTFVYLVTITEKTCQSEMFKL